MSSKRKKTTAEDRLHEDLMQLEQTKRAEAEELVKLAHAAKSHANRLREAARKLRPTGFDADEFETFCRRVIPSNHSPMDRDDLWKIVAESAKKDGTDIASSGLSLHFSRAIKSGLFESVDGKYKLAAPKADRSV